MGYLQRTFRPLRLWYQQWHTYPYHPHTHWAICCCIALLAGGLLFLQGFFGRESVHPTQVYAQSPTVVTIDGSQSFQTITGFGAWMTGPEWYVTGVDAKMNEALDAMVYDLGLTIAHFTVPAGSEMTNDNDDPNVINLSAFDPSRIIPRDGQCTGGSTPGTKCRSNTMCGGGGTCSFQAGAFDDGYNIDMDVLMGLKDRGMPHFFFEPFSVPPWMKTSGLLSGRENGGSVSDPAEYGEWMAGSLLKLSQAPYNIPIEYVGILNEPKYCVETCADQNVLIALIDAFAQQLEKPVFSPLANVKIIAPSEGRPWDAPGAQWVANAKNAGLDIFSHHQYCSSGHEDPPCSDALTQIGDDARNVGIEVWMSEQSGNDEGPESAIPGDSFAEGLELAEAIHEDFTRAGSTAWLFWTAMATRGDAAPAAGTPGYSAPIRLTYYDASQFWKSPKYYALKRFSRNIPEGAQRVDVSNAPSGVKMTAYAHPNGTLTIVALNKNSSATPITLQLSGGLTAASFNRYQYAQPCVYGNDAGCDTTESSVAPNQAVTLPALSVTTFTTGSAPSCNPSSWTQQGCGMGNCAQTQMYQTRTVDPAGCAATSRCVADPQCGGTSDAFAPVVQQFSVQPTATTAGNSVVASWTVHDTGGSHLQQVELWRALYVPGTCDDAHMGNCSWARVATVAAPASSDDWVSETSHTPSQTLYYGLHAVDIAGNVGYEPAPVYVAVDAGGESVNQSPNRPLLSYVGPDQGGICGSPGDACTVGVCSGTCDSSGNVCMKTDPQCGITPAQCADGLDNDDDGKIDYPVDLGCTSAQDNNETDISGTCHPFTSLVVQANNSQSITTSFATQSGAMYRIRAQGTYQYWYPAHPEALADAEFVETAALGNPGWTNPTNNELLVNNQDHSWGAYSSSHDYTLELPGDGQPLSFKILDDYYTDNQGSISVTIEECVGSQQYCGNGQIDPGEQCDGTNFNNQTCQTQGFQSGTLACNPPGGANACRFNTSQCVSPPVCTPDLTCTTFQGCQGTCNTAGTQCNDNPGDNCPAPPVAGSFPRTAFWQWDGATDPEWYAQFDLVMVRGTNPSFIQEVRSHNPDIIWLPARDFNKASEGIPGFPESWVLHDSAGNRIELYGPDDYWVNYADVAPVYSGTIDGIPASNERLATWYARYLKRLVDNAGSDGIATDGLYSRFHLTYNMFSDVDLDRNGQNDLTEQGKGREWVLTHWENGVKTLLQNIRSQLGPDKIILINTGNDQAPDYNTIINGLVFEHTGPEYNWNYSRTERQQLNAGMAQPYVFLNNNHPNGDSIVSPQERDLRSMRFGLGRSMLLDDYFEFTERSGGNDEHYWGRYYDEFDVDLGTPTSEMQLVRSTGPSDQGVWVRFFQNGAVVVNISGTDQAVSNADLTGKTGYAGPYYRFEGGQDRAINGVNAMNNGQQFASVMLRGMSDPDPAGAFSGDAIVLVMTPQKIVSDIIIDTTSMSTSVGSNKAILNGFTPLDCPDAQQYYTLRCGWNTGTHSLATASSNGATAEFIPTIGIAGNYEVFEWHGIVSNLCANVGLTINGQSQPVINQATNPGQWNSRGTHYFSGGTNGAVVLSAPGGCTAQADAIKFVYRGGGSAMGETTLARSEGAVLGMTATHPWDNTFTRHPLTQFNLLFFSITTGLSALLWLLVRGKVY